MSVVSKDCFEEIPTAGGLVLHGSDGTLGAPVKGGGETVGGGGGLRCVVLEAVVHVVVGGDGESFPRKERMKINSKKQNLQTSVHSGLGELGSGQVGILVELELGEGLRCRTVRKTERPKTSHLSSLDGSKAGKGGTEVGEAGVVLSKK